MNYPFDKQTRYRCLGKPVKGQQLHFLYPGRLMSNQYHHTGYNIPHEDPKGLEKTIKELDEVERLSEIEDQKIADYLGGGHDIGESPLGPDYPHRGDPDHPYHQHKKLLGYHSKGFSIKSEEEDSENENTTTNGENSIENFETEPLDDVHHNEPFGFSFDSIKNHIWIWVISIVVLILLIIGIIFIIHEVRKNK